MNSIRPLDWHPKLFRPGDLDNSGSERLLGNPKLSKVDTLVREMAQNSWDARLDDWQPAFHLRLREGSVELRQKLRTLLQNDLASSPLKKSLQDPHFHVLEILDRGTSGLDGPIDMTEGEPRNFQDLILKVGVPRSSGKGGGTFGFGKTAAYAYSRVGTVVYWTRCKNAEGELEHRFIVSAFRKKFERAGIQYTGRHWWGATNEKGEVSPIVGDEAQRLGESLFEWDFSEDETGTSMLILHPPLRETVEVTQDMDALPFTEMHNFHEIVAEWGSQVRHSIRRHLWPKLVAHPLTDQAPMLMTLTVNGEEVSLKSEEAGMIDQWALALNAVRAQQDGSDEPIRNRRVTVHEIRHQGSLDGVRKARTLGHMAIVRRFPDSEIPGNGEDLDPITSPDQGRVVRMRNVPELVVNSKDFITAQPHEGMDWLAVFKPTREMDDVFAASEPPAHDDWVPEGLDRERQLIIQHTDRRIRQILEEELFKPEDASGGRGRRVSTAKLSKKLAQLLPAERTESLSARKRKAFTQRQASGPRIVITSSELVKTDEKVRQVHRLGLRVEGPGNEAEILLGATFVGADGTQDRIRPDLLEVHWEGARGVGPGTAVCRVGEEVDAYVHAEQGRAMKISVTVRAIHGDD